MVDYYVIRKLLEHQRGDTGVVCSDGDRWMLVGHKTLDDLIDMAGRIFLFLFGRVHSRCTLSGLVERLPRGLGHRRPQSISVGILSATEMGAWGGLHLPFCGSVVRVEARVWEDGTSRQDVVCLQWGDGRDVFFIIFTCIDGDRVGWSNCLILCLEDSGNKSVGEVSGADGVRLEWLGEGKFGDAAMVFSRFVLKIVAEYGFWVGWEQGVSRGWPALVWFFEHIRSPGSSSIL